MIDKVLHFGIMFCAGAVAATFPPGEMVMTAGAAAVIAAGKEWHDHLNYGATWAQCWPDLVADALGLAAGITVVLGLFR